MEKAGVQDRQASTGSGSALFATCLPRALGALTGEWRLAKSCLRATRPAHAGRRWPSPAAGSSALAQRVPTQNGRLCAWAPAIAAALSGPVAVGLALYGPRLWLWVALGATAVAVALTASNRVWRGASAATGAFNLLGRQTEGTVQHRIGNLSSANRKLVDTQWSRRQLLDLTLCAAEGERARIAANLHDGPIQRLAALGLVLDRCKLRLNRDDSEGALDLMQRARNELSDEISNLRQMMSDLRPPVLDEGGLDAALHDQLSSWTATTAIESHFETTAHADLSSDSETVVYRVVQEALANVAKHARASLVTVTLTQWGNGVKVVVRDNGTGFSPRPQRDMLRRGHFGLAVMRERVELASGRFEMKSVPHAGTQIIAWLPATLGRERLGAA